MRLIDADALITEMVKVPGNRWSTKTLGEALDKIGTIDAIPVEWLLQKSKQPLTTDGNPFEYVLLEWLMEWLMEQEAKK